MSHLCGSDRQVLALQALVPSPPVGVLGRCLELLSPTKWKELGLNQNRWHALVMFIIYLQRETGGAGTGGNPRTHPARRPSHSFR
ncbi:BQ5605_C016g08164 [Microbotryum silenes-dioicae]|uniref:BQ5605_C016g08164 protein n=1 Tax=Microbotryum silenes-dioicae TaxID=796604 RepID=A0A2X0LZE5_9BASI|nr:BQ5605_C016g08164 [Microbotryum silenes-dioicae]